MPPIRPGTTAISPQPTTRTGRAAQRALDPSGTAAFLLLAVVVGILVGVGAALLFWTTGWVGEAFEALGDAASLGRYLPLVSIPTGFLLAWWIAFRFAPEVQGDGVPQAMAALQVRNGYLPSRSGPFKVAATALTIGSGGSAGREGPIVFVGAALGSMIARYGGQGEDKIRSLVAAGAGAGIGASFNAPIAGMLFALEVILGNFAIRHLNVVVIASVSASVTNRLLVGEERLLIAPDYRLDDPRELLLYALLGLLAVAAAILFLRLLDLVERQPGRVRLPRWLRPLSLGLGVGTLGIFFPEVLGDGQEFVGSTVRSLGETNYMWWTLLVLALMKIIATSGTLGAHTSGGAFMPSLFVGASLGAAFAQFLAPVWGFSELQAGAFAVVGMAATFAAVARAPLTAILIVFEITGDYSLVLPLMLAGALATFLADRIHPDSVYTMPLTRAGIKLVRSSEIDVLDTVTVGEVMSVNPIVIDPAMSLAEVDEMLDRHKHHGLAVVAEEELAGIITISDIMRAGGPSDELRAGDAMTPRPVTVTPTTPVSVALERMAALGVGRLPVVDDDEPSRLVGMFRRPDAVSAYHRALSTSTEHELSRQRLRLRTDPGARFFDFQIPLGSVADDRLIREIGWPEGLTLVSVRRGRNVMVPSGNSQLRAGDVVTAFGTPTARERLISRLNATGVEETAEMPAVASTTPEGE